MIKVETIQNFLKKIQLNFFKNKAFWNNIFPRFFCVRFALHFMNFIPLILCFKDRYADKMLQYHYFYNIFLFNFKSAKLDPNYAPTFFFLGKYQKEMIKDFVCVFTITIYN